MLRKPWLPLMIAPAVALSGCMADSTTTQTPLTPSVAAISPTTVVAGSADLALTVTGHYFVASTSNGSKALWVVGSVSTLLPTNVVSTEQLTALVPASLLSHSANAQVMVQTGDPAVATSNAVSFVVQAPPPKGGGE